MEESYHRPSESGRQEDIRDLIKDILDRFSLSWDQAMILIHSLTVAELNKLQNEKKNDISK